jgi:hypothetical protein
MDSSTERGSSWLVIPGRGAFEINAQPAWSVLRVSDRPEPGPRDWVIKDWIPEGYLLTCLVSRGGGRAEWPRVGRAPREA